MIFPVIGTIIAILSIFYIGLLFLCAFDGLTDKLKPALLLSISWLCGCFLIAAGSTISLFLSFTGLPFNLITILIPLFILLFAFHKKILSNFDILLNNIKNYKPDILKDLTLYERMLSLFLLAILVIFSTEVLFLNAVKPTWAWDAWMIWSLKGKLLFSNTFDLTFLRTPGYHTAHPDYPIFVPLVLSFIAKFAGIFDGRYVQVFHSITYISFIIMLYSFTRQFVNKVFCLLIVISIACLPVMFLNFTGAYVDCIVMTYNMLTIYFIYNYLKADNNTIIDLVPVFIGIGSMLMIKNEGSLYFLTLLFVSSIAIKLFKTEFMSHFKRFLLIFGAALCCHLPWVILTKTMGITNRFLSPEKGHEINIISQLNEIPEILDFLIFQNMLRFPFWGILFYVFIALLAIGIIKRKKMELVFFAGTLLLNLAGVIMTYVISTHDLHTHMVSSFDRVVLSTLPLVLCFMIAVLPEKEPETS